MVCVDASGCVDMAGSTGYTALIDVLTNKHIVKR